VQGILDACTIRPAVNQVGCGLRRRAPADHCHCHCHCRRHCYCYAAAEPSQYTSAVLVLPVVAALVLQVEAHPYWRNDELVRWCQASGEAAGSRCSSMGASAALLWGLGVRPCYRLQRKTACALTCMRVWACTTAGTRHPCHCLLAPGLAPHRGFLQSRGHAGAVAGGRNCWYRAVQQFGRWKAAEASLDGQSSALIGQSSVGHLWLLSNGRHEGCLRLTPSA